MRRVLGMTSSSYYFVAANLVLLALVAYSASAIVNTAIATRMVAPVRVELSPPPDPIGATEPKPADYYAFISHRDIFNSAPAVTPAGPPPTEAPPPNLKLIGVSVHDDGSSYCVVEDQKGHQQDLYRIGETVAGTDATVKKISWGRCVLDRAGSELILDLPRTPNAGSAPAPTPGRGGAGASARLPSAAASGPAADEHIRAISDTEFEIDRSEVDQALENMSQLFTQMRAVPQFDGGKSIGFRVFAIRRNSLFDKIGIKNGDVVQKINGQDLTDPARALALLQELRNERALSVDVLRNRQQQTLSYQIR